GGPVGAARRPLPGVLDPAAGRGARPRRRPGRYRRGHPRPGRRRGDRDRRPRAAAALQPDRLGRDDPGGPGHRRGGPPYACAGRGALPHRRGPPRPRDGPTTAAVPRDRGVGRGRGPALRRPPDRLPRRVARGRERRRPGGRARGGRHPGPGRTADDDRSGRHRRDGAGRGGPGWVDALSTREDGTVPLPVPPARLTAIALEGVPEVGPGDDLADLFLTALAANGERLHDDDVVLVTSKVVSKAEDRLRTGDRDAALAG